MAAVCLSYPTHEEARVAVDAALAAGVPGEDVLVVSGEVLRDARDQPVGEFGGTTEAGAPVGDFAGGTSPQGSSTGEFAGRSHRGGSFGDSDTDYVTTYPEGVERMMVAGHRRLTRLLVDIGLDEPTAKRDVAALHDGKVLVVVEIPDAEAARITAVLAS